MVKLLTLENEVEEFAARISDAFSHLNELGKGRFSTSTSIGISVYPKDGKSIDALTTSTDLAMDCSKKLQIDSWCWFNADADENGRRHGQIAIRLRSAVADGSLRFVFQLQISIKKNKLLAVEELLLDQQRA